jgi:O-antigen ligase
MFVLPRLPFREDKVFSLLFLIVLTVPLVFTWQTYEKYETVKLAVWLFLLGWIFLLFLFKKQSLSPDSRANWLLVGFLGFGLVSAFLGYSRLNGFLGLYPRFTSGFVFYFLWIATLFFFIGVLNRQKWQVLLRLLFFDGVLVAIVGVLQSYGVGFYTGIDQAAVSRAPGLLGNPNFSSMFLAVILPFTLPLSISAKKVAAKLYYALGSLVMLWAVVNFSSRGAWLGLGAAFLFMVGVLAVKRTRKKLILSIVSFAAIFAILLSFTLHVVRPGSIESVVRMSETNIDLRFFAWNVAIDIIGKHPVLGFGPGSLQNYFEQFRGSNLAMQSGIFDDAHNLFLQLAATTGLPSALIFIGLLLLAILFNISIFCSFFHPI